MSNMNFKPGDRVQVVKECIIQSKSYGGYILNGFQASYIYATESQIQPLPPFKRGDMVLYKRAPDTSNALTVIACFFNEYGNPVFFAKGWSSLFSCDYYELFTPQNDEQ